MDFLTLLLVLTSVLCTLFCVLVSNYWYRRRSAKLPPGPIPLPIIGNLLHLGKNPHQSLAKLAKTYGPLMHLKLGSIDTIVVSSPEIAKEILQKHDQTFSSRAIPCAAQAMDHDKFSIGWLPTGNKWRRLRKICKEEMFTSHKLEASESLRQEKLQQMRDHLNECCKSKEVVGIVEVTFVTALNLISATMFSIDLAHYGSDSVHEMKDIVEGMMKVLGTPNLADYFPLLRKIDPQGIRRETGAYFEKLLTKFDEIISERLESRGAASPDLQRKADLLEALLDINQENSDSGLTRNDIKHFLLDLFVAGADTSVNTVLWAMAELLRNPEKMLKAKNELITVIGENKKIEESDISRFPYLRAVVKETFRCHPAGPFLIPHKADANVEINGYLVPKNAQILVNVWAIGHDPRIWPNPHLFEPERFLDCKIDYRGQDFELLPFGSGRRMCPGLPLGHLMVHLMLASLIHNFDWKLEHGMKPEDLDMSELFGLSLHKAVPLKAFPIKK